MQENNIMNLNESQQTESLKVNMEQLEKVLMKSHRIDPNLYLEYDVKRGLRDSAGKGVLTGLTEVSDVCAYNLVNGRMIPADGELYYQGINVKDLINGLRKTPGSGRTEHVPGCHVRTADTERTFSQRCCHESIQRKHHECHAALHPYTLHL